MKWDLQLIKQRQSMMINETDELKDAFKKRHTSVIITTRNASKRTKNRRRIIWAKDLTEILGEESHMSHAVSPVNSSSERTEWKIKGILKMPKIGKQAKIQL